MKRKQSRKRLIIQQPSNGGQECPEVLEEEKDCEVPKICPGFRYNCSDATFFYSMDRYMMYIIAKEVALYQFNQRLLYITNGETVWLHYNVSNLMLHHYHKTVALKAAELLLDVRITETDVNTCHLPNTAEMLALSAAALSDLFVCC